jgi:hypothetical protein
MSFKAFTFPLVLAFCVIVSLPCTATENDGPTVIPFQLKGNSIMVQATINGQTGDFIIDTGAPDLMLSDAYFAGVDMTGVGSQKGIVDLKGHFHAVKLLAIEAFQLGPLDLPGKYGLVTDLREIEKIKGGIFLGIIGYPTLKNFEIHFDFEIQELTLVPLAKKGLPVSQVAYEAPTEVFELKFSDHIPYLITYASGKKIRLGIDSGSEVNVLHEQFFEKSDLQITDTRNIKIQGLSGSLTSAQHGSLTGLAIEQHIDGPVDMTLTDLRPMNETLPINLHGMLGVAYLKNVRFSINYKKKELCIWSDQMEAPLVENGASLDMEATIDKK